MRNHFYPFQQAASFNQTSFSPQNFLPARGMNPFGGFGPQMQPPVPVTPPSKFDSILQTADKLFNTAQSYTPYIKQAGPMMKNIPSLYRMYKGFKGLPDADTDAAPDRRRSSRSSNRPDSRPPARQRTREQVDLTPKPSKPRIFQPPFE